MNLRKSIFFKTTCIAITVLFTAHCVTIREGKLLSSEQKRINEPESLRYKYKIEMIKSPSIQDPTARYKIVKFRLHLVDEIKRYEKLKKPNRIGTGVLGGVLGLLAGGFAAGRPDTSGGLNNVIGGSIGGLVGLTVGILMNKTKRAPGEIKTIDRLYGAPDSSNPIPAQNIPVEIRSIYGNNGESFKTRTDDNGVFTVNLIDDFKVTDFSPDHPVKLNIQYMNVETNIIETTCI